MSMPPEHKKLPPQPSLEHLRKQAKRLAKSSSELDLAHAQHQLAQEYGFKNWTELADYVSDIEEGGRINAIYTQINRKIVARWGRDSDHLAELLRFWDLGMKSVRSMGGVRRSFLLGAIARLGKFYPPALEALRERQRALASALHDQDAWSDYFAINRALNDNSATLRSYDAAMAATEIVPKRKFLFWAMLEAKRYKEAVEIMSSSTFAKASESPLVVPSALGVDLSFNPQMAKMLFVASVVNPVAQEFEAYAGAGQLELAKKVLARVLAVDRSELVIAKLREHAERCGHVELLEEALGSG